MKDIAHLETDKLIEHIEKELNHAYSECFKTLKKKLKDIYLKLDMSLPEEERVKLLNQSKRIQKLINSMAIEIQSVNKNAVEMVRENTYTCYAINHDYSTFILEHSSGLDTGYNVFNREAVKRLLKGEELPFTLIAYDELTDKSRIVRELTRQLTQSIILGESITKMAKRIQDVTNKNYKSSVTIARTEMTRVQNAGRLDSFKRGEALGLKLKKKWISTIDSRTRVSHAKLMGETVDLDKPFSNGLMHPGGVGKASEVINCRCTHIVEFEGFKKSEAELKLDETLKKMSYEQWRDLHDRG